MAFMDIFRPKWQSKDPKKRKEAVNKLDDQELLKKIVKNDKNSAVPATAVKKLG